MLMKPSTGPRQPGGIRCVPDPLSLNKHKSALMIFAENIHKKFKEIKAVDGLSLEVPSGMIYGLIGPNGAGKTTTIRILSGLMRPDKGVVRLNDVGMDSPERIRRMVGSLIEQPGLYGKLSLVEYLVFFSRMYDIKKKQARSRIDELLELLELKDRKQERLQGFSLGMKQKVALARILLHDPPVLLLDEPTAGLDPLINKKVRDYLLGRNSRDKKTVLVSTHNLDEASRVCDEIAIIHQGRILEQGSWEQLRRRHASRARVVIYLKEALPSYQAIFSDHPGIESYDDDLEKKTVSFVTDSMEETNPDIITRLVNRGGEIIHIDTEGTSLEYAYLNLIGKG